MTTILLVEDAADLAQVILRELEAAGYEVVHAAFDAWIVGIPYRRMLAVCFW